MEVESRSSGGILGWKIWYGKGVDVRVEGREGNHGWTGCVSLPEGSRRSRFGWRVRIGVFDALSKVMIFAGNLPNLAFPTGHPSK